MNIDLLAGVAVASLSGLVMGVSAWPLALMKRFRYEQFALLSMAFALFVLPWAITLATCPDALAAYQSIPIGLLVKANLFSMAWGVAQVLALLCFARIGVSLTYGILCSIGAFVGVLTPMIFKASGVFANAPDLLSRPGLTALAGVLVMIGGVVFASLAGFGREQLQRKSESSASPPSSGGFAVGLAMVIAAGILSAGWGFAFAYSQGPIIEAMKARGAGDLAAGVAVWAVSLMGAGLVNVVYPALLLTRNGSWGVLATQPRDVMLSLLYGFLFFIPSVLLGAGMLLLGQLGVSVGTGMSQIMLILGGQFLGFALGEWRGVTGAPLRNIMIAISLLVVAMGILVLANSGERTSEPVAQASHPWRVNTDAASHL